MPLSLRELIATLEMYARMQGDNTAVSVNGSTRFTVAFDSGSTHMTKPFVTINNP